MTNVRLHICNFFVINYYSLIMAKERPEHAADIWQTGVTSH